MQGTFAPARRLAGAGLAQVSAWWLNDASAATNHRPPSARHRSRRPCALFHLVPHPKDAPGTKPTATARTATTGDVELAPSSRRGRPHALLRTAAADRENEAGEPHWAAGPVGEMGIVQANRGWQVRTPCRSRLRPLCIQGIAVRLPICGGAGSSATRRRHAASPRSTTPAGTPRPDASSDLLRRRTTPCTTTGSRRRRWAPMATTSTTNTPSTNAHI